MHAPKQQTFARTITVCGSCGREVQQLKYDAAGGRGTIYPCGHTATMRVILNPELEKASS